MSGLTPKARAVAEAGRVLASARACTSVSGTSSPDCEDPQVVAFFTVSVAERSLKSPKIVEIAVRLATGPLALFACQPSGILPAQEFVHLSPTISSIPPCEGRGNRSCAWDDVIPQRAFDSLAPASPSSHSNINCH